MSVIFMASAILNGPHLVLWAIFKAGGVPHLAPLLHHRQFDLHNSSRTRNAPNDAVQEPGIKLLLVY